jgi:hypothetical protein
MVELENSQLQNGHWIFFVLQSICGTTNQCEESYLDSDLIRLLLHYNFRETEEFIFDKEVWRERSKEKRN